MNQPFRAAIAGAAVLALLLTGCGGSDEPESGASTSAEPDFAATDVLWHKWLDAHTHFGAVQQESAKAISTYMHAHPDATLEAPALTKATNDIKDASAELATAFEALEEDPALDTPELEKSWGDLSRKATESQSFNDTLFANYATLQISLRGCAALFSDMSRIKLAIDGSTNKARYATFRKSGPACADPMKTLAASGNPMLETYAKGYLANYEKRVALLKKGASGKIDQVKLAQKYNAIADADSKLGDALDLQGELNRLYPRDEIDAFADALHKAPGVKPEGGPSASPSASSAQ